MARRRLDAMERALDRVMGGIEGPATGDRDRDGDGQRDREAGQHGEDDRVHGPSIAHRTAHRRRLGATLCGVLSRLIPREERFFSMFAEDAANVLGAARLFEAMLRTYDAPEARAREIRDAEHRGDEISHDIGHRLEATFVTPFDREEIYALISGLDDVLDYIEECADTFVLYRVEAPTAVAVQQASIIVKQCEQLNDALSHLRGFRGLDKYWIEVHRLENEGDALARQAIADLFSNGQSPLDVIKWKDIYALLESTIDKCEDVANIIERITIKHA
jgi:predicted phosphate transport protein (TIGR00153 family)